MHVRSYSACVKRAGESAHHPSHLFSYAPAGVDQSLLDKDVYGLPGVPGEGQGKGLEGLGVPSGLVA